VLFRVTTTDYGAFLFKVKGDLDVDAVIGYVANTLRGIVKGEVKANFSKYITIEKV